MMPPQAKADIRARETSAKPPREYENREATSRKKQWQPAALLPDPDDAKRPDSPWSYRWIRTSTLEHSDAINVNRQRREGWEPVSSSEFPEMSELAHPDGSIRTGGLMLCRRAKEITVSHREAIAAITARQFESVDQRIKGESQPARAAGMRMLEPERTISSSSSPND